MQAPAVTIVGDVAALTPELSWLRAARPLTGVSVAVTRARAQASELAARLRSLGAIVVEAPAIRIEPLDVVIPPLDEFDLICVTSPNGAEQLLARVHDARALAGPPIAAIGPGTARALQERGIRADIVPERAIAESLIEALRDVPVKNALVARAQNARDLLPDALRERGAEVTVLPLYRTVAEPLTPEARAAALGADYATFTSASSARFFREAAGTLAGPRLVSIGPVTSEALRALGAEPDVEAPVHTPDGLVDALLEDAAGRRLNAGSVGACAFSSSERAVSASPRPPSLGVATSSTGSCSPTWTTTARRPPSTGSATRATRLRRSTRRTRRRSSTSPASRAPTSSSTPATRG